MSSKDASDGPISPPQPSTTPTNNISSIASSVLSSILNSILSSILSKLQKNKKIVIGVSSASLMILGITVTIATAQPCLPNVVGDDCDKCAENHWNIDNPTGCQFCDCDPNGKIVIQRQHYFRRITWQVPATSSVTRGVANASVETALMGNCASDVLTVLLVLVCYGLYCMNYKLSMQLY